jgi:hypothetical protein
LLIVGAMFALYRFTLAQWVEPRIEIAGTLPPSETETKLGPSKYDLLEPFQLLFPEGSWERDRPIILESEGAKFLLSDYENLRDGRVRLSRCSIIFLPDGDVDFANPQKRLIIMQAPEGAVLEFDQPIDLAQFKVGRLIGGQLNGRVEIRGTPSRPGANDALHVLTRDVQTNEERLWTPHAVAAKIGPHQLNGTELNIRWLPSTASGPKRKGPSVGGIESFELVRDVRMILQPGAGGLLPGDRAAEVDPAKPAAAPQPPIEVRCAGSFEFLLLDRYATFEEQVSVQRMFPNGVTDRLTGDLLRIDFQPRVETTAKPEPTALEPLPGMTRVGEAAANPAEKTAAPRQSSLEPRRMTVKGKPVQVRAPSSQVQLDAEHLEYDLTTGRVMLDGEREIHLKQNQNEYHGRTVSYEPNPNGGLGRLAATGPGWLRSVGTDPRRGALEVVFETSLKMRPHEANHVVSVVGKARVKSPAMGEIAGDELHLWLLELPRDPNQKARPNRGQGDLLGGGTANALPDRLLAIGPVQFQTPQLMGETKRLEIWFDPQGMIAAAQAGPAAAAARVVPLRTVRSGSDANMPSLATESPARSPFALNSAAPGQELPNAANANAAPVTPRKYRVVGDLIRAQLKVRVGQQTLEDLTIDGKLDFKELATEEGKPNPMSVIGDHLEILQASTPLTQVTVTGKPAKINAQGLETAGDTIRMDRKQNRVWVEGAGRLNLPEGAPRPNQTSQVPGAANNPLARPSGPVTIDFVDGLEFDGQIITIRRDVLVNMNQTRSSAEPGGAFPGVANQPGQPHRAALPVEKITREFRTVRTQEIIVKLKDRIDLQNAGAGRVMNNVSGGSVPGASGPEAELLTCKGGFVLETREDDLQGTPLTWQQLNALDLNYAPPTGAIAGTGPGEMVSIRRGNGANRVPTMPLAGGAAATAAPANTDELQYLRIEYRRGFRGNMNQRLVTFDNQIQAVAGSVAGWADRLDADKPELLGPRGMVLHTDQLVVAESPQRDPRNPQRASMELQAISNVKIEGARFTGLGYRLTYAQDKDQLVLEGDGRNDAELYSEQGIGAPRSRAAAGRLMFYPGSNRVDVEGGRMIDLSQLGNTPTANTPAANPPKKK